MKKTFPILCLLLGVKSTMMAQMGNNCANAIPVAVKTVLWAVGLN